LRIVVVHWIGQIMAKPISFAQRLHRLRVADEFHF
jgi:hypothetical protein